MIVLRMCETTYLPATNFRGSKVRAQHMTTNRKVVVSWDYELDTDGNHAAAAREVLGREPEFRTAVAGGGFLFGVDPHNDP